MKCPVCGAVYRPPKGSIESPLFSTASSSPSCRRCKADLSDLVRLHDQAIWYHKQAVHLLAQRLYPEAAAHNDRALALYYGNADFHALAGKLSALQGEFREASSSWQQALKFDPQNAIACHCLQAMELMAKNYDT
ncbi:hypothetical protein F7734_36850 [Scytonema sp. UIC 10036]|uniref:hypothetical protein n=1 Tax=Scytonema sp. UIC 10036 TaxID=2304196 RepID=UPI0012DA6B28|nr:hypothetical protein [Scytonema sp. UIC 10036]MUG97593.1 hypothetical protein [Scytonema sp. UIC 10036]